ncbi:MAG TPA: ATP synthase F1 subunit gamma [Bacteroidia bacterium]|nr:ATP synthase F1 subunit gamma [Bacteroidia bacterium]HNP97685.1 ATP synthase F1 subunit gamma [Bacteroidia bacterium]
MANLKEVRNRIASVISTQQITKAMKMVSAAKLRRAQDAIVMMRPYASKLRDIMENISGTLEGGVGGELTKARPVEKVLIVAVNSNRGLCGAFNAVVIRTVNRLIREEYSRQAKEGNVKVLCIGKKASDFFNKHKNLYAGNHNELYAKLTFENVSAVADSIMKEFAAGQYDRVDIVYNQFKNAAVQYIQHEQMLPVAPPMKKGNDKNVVNDYIFEPGKEQLVLELLPKSVRIQLFKAVLDSHASEHGARMTAMSKATDNAGDLLKELRLSYNKARQAAITGEILEIVAGAEALNG